MDFMVSILAIQTSESQVGFDAKNVVELVSNAEVTVKT